jgi:predicted RNA-binding Zn ribbon-like protein
VRSVETASSPARPPGIRELPIVAGHLALDFANTVDDPLGPQRWDHVADHPALVTWGERVGIVSADAAATLRRAAAEHPDRAATAVQEGADLRAALNDVFGAVVDGTPVDAGWLRLRPFVAAAVARADLAPAAPYPVLAWSVVELGAPLWPVADAAYRLLTGLELRRLKRCVACPWLFLDRSRNGSRRWCSMEICGTDEKIRRYVTRRAARRGAEGR